MAEVTLDIRRLVGRWTLAALSHLGRLSLLFVELTRAITEWRIWVPRAFEQAQQVGYGSLFIVILVAAFAGAVISIQTGYQFTGNVPLYVVGGIVVQSIVLELGPVLTGLILAGRIGARYAAELGTMRVTEQIDALESLGRSPVSHLLLPRILAGTVMLPLLVIFADLTGVITGWYLARLSLGLTNAEFVKGAQFFFQSWDLWYSLIKSTAFGLAVTVIPCYLGFTTQQGAEGVGRATTTAVVSASVLILFLDMLLTQLLLA